MFLEQRLANIESQLAGVLELLREREYPQVSVTSSPLFGAPVSGTEEQKSAPEHKHPDMAAERARIKSALMALRRAGGDPNAVLSKAGITRLSEVTTPEIVSAIDTLIDDDQ